MARYIDADLEVSKYVTVWDCDCSEFGKQTVMAVDDLHYLPTADVAPRAEWISVDERLPDENGVFLVSLKESGYENLVYFDVRPYADGEWRNLPDKLTVSHWMPLPEPPKGD